jgi:DNA-nicking Smr family endonuclease
MSRRRRQPPPRSPSKTPPFHAPFSRLAKAIKPAAPPVKAPGTREATPPARPPAEDLEPELAFAAAMADVRPLGADPRVDAPAPASLTVRPRVDEDGEALAVLSDLVAGSGEFDLSDSTEYVEGAVVGLDPRILRRLRRGEFAYQAMIDLHGMSAAAARVEVERFLTGALAGGHRAVLIVHGRGRNSKDNVPVLKERLKSWLARGRIGRGILAFTSARPADGGTGALYVLLRRRRGIREPIRVFEGAKRE